MDPTVQFWNSRNRLVGLLSEAAELEHALCCTYLFAAFSMKTHVDEGGVTLAQVEMLRQWKGTLLFIARQEMEHLAITCNLLTAMGELPYFRRPNFPSEKDFYPVGLPVELRAFSLETVANFLLFELPVTGERGAEEPQVEELLKTLSGSKVAFDLRLAKHIVRRRKAGSATIGNIYAEIRTLIDTLGHETGRSLLVGPPDAQVRNALFRPAGTDFSENMYGVKIVPVTDIDSALAAVQQIRVEGESAPSRPKDGPKDGPKDEGGHFSRFKKMYLDLSQMHMEQKERKGNEDFIPGRKVVRNPLPKGTPRRPKTTRITHPLTSEAVAACDLGYEILLRMLLRLFAQTDQGDKEVEALKAAVFFPMMTAVVRPFGEVLTLLPASTRAGDERRAGSAFQSPRRVDFLPHGPAAWQVLHGQLLELRGRVQALSEDPRLPSQHVRDRLTMLYQNIWRIAFNFANALGLKAQP